MEYRRLSLTGKWEHWPFLWRENRPMLEVCADPRPVVLGLCRCSWRGRGLGRWWCVVEQAAVGVAELEFAVGECFDGAAAFVEGVVVKVTS